MKLRALAALAFCLAAFPAIDAAHAATPQAAIESETPGAIRRAERLRHRLGRAPARAKLAENPAAARRRERIEARARRIASPETAPAPAAERVFTLVNDARRKEGLRPLSWNATLANTAQAYAEDMAARGFFSHEDPEGGMPRDRILAGGYAKPSCDCSWTYGTGENLAQGQGTAEKAMRDWLASPGHRENILSPDFEDIGVGHADGHWVQHFGVSKVLP